MSTVDTALLRRAIDASPETIITLDVADVVALLDLVDNARSLRDALEMVRCQLLDVRLTLGRACDLLPDEKAKR